MDRILWEKVDGYLSDVLVGSDLVLEQVLRNCQEAELPNIQVSHTQAKLLHILAKAIGARRILEIGTLGAYSTIWLARALPSDGKLISLEVNPKYAEVANRNVNHANLSTVVEIRIGKAVDALPLMKKDNIELFDFVFIDADKENNDVYLNWALQLTRKGGIIVCDNVIRDGAVADAESPDARIQATRGMLENLGKSNLLDATAIQTVGSKGYDGFAIARVR